MLTKSNVCLQTVTNIREYLILLSYLRRKMPSKYSYEMMNSSCNQKNWRSNQCQLTPGPASVTVTKSALGMEWPGVQILAEDKALCSRNCWVLLQELLFCEGKIWQKKKTVPSTRTSSKNNYKKGFLDVKYQEPE